MPLDREASPFPCATACPRPVLRLRKKGGVHVHLRYSLPALVIRLRSLEPVADQPHIGQWCFHALCRFLLEGVQHIHRACEAHRVYRSIGVTTIVFGDFKYPRPLSFSRLGIRMFRPKLCEAQSVAHIALYLDRESQVIPFRGADPMQGLLGRQ